MIDPIDPDMKDMCLLAITDQKGSHLTVHKTSPWAGLVVSKIGKELSGVAIQLDRRDRAALIAQLIELQEDETLE